MVKTSTFQTGKWRILLEHSNGSKVGVWSPTHPFLCVYFFNRMNLLYIAGCCGKLYLTKAEFCKIYDKIEKKELDIIFRVFDVDKSNVISVEQIISG